MQPPARPGRPPSVLKTLSGYALMLVLAGGGLWTILGYGADLRAPSAAGLVESAGAPHRPPQELLLHVLLALIVIIIASRLLGALFRRMQQPQVIGEVIAGILLGPSLLGRIAPHVQAFVLPDSVAPYLGIVAQVGVILFMFLVGLELETGLLRSRSHVTIAISHASIVVPFLLGALLALWLYPVLSDQQVSFTHFALFMGVSMSVTAFPVLARILTDRGLHRSQLGVIALSCAAVDDVSAWCLLAAIVGLVRAQGSGGVLITLGLTLSYIGFMLVMVRRSIERWLLRAALTGGAHEGASAWVLVGLLVSALITESIGIHALFGAFLLGAVIPHDSDLARQLARKLHDVVVVLLLPAFFAYTGMRTRLSLLDSWQDALFCALIVSVACLGKFGGTTLAGRLTGLSLRDAAALGVLMNTRGLMELIVLNVGLDLGVISPRLFARLVVMAVVTTLATSPLLSLFSQRGSLSWDVKKRMPQQL
jgi:Kef-type K+ transport system membrane component KefB